METIIAALVTGSVTLVGVLISNARSKAVIECKLDELSRRVEVHNRVVERVYGLEHRASVIERDLEILDGKAGIR